MKRTFAPRRKRRSPDLVDQRESGGAAATAAIAARPSATTSTPTMDRLDARVLRFCHLYVRGIPHCSVSRSAPVDRVLSRACVCVS